MSTSLNHAVVAPTTHVGTADDALTRVSARFGLAFTICQLGVMVAMAILVLPHGGSPNDPALERGRHVLDAEDAYRWGNYAFMLAGCLLLLTTLGHQG